MPQKAQRVSLLESIPRIEFRLLIPLTKGELQGWGYLKNNSLFCRGSVIQNLLILGHAFYPIG